MGETRPREGASTLLKVKETYGLRGGARGEIERGLRQRHVADSDTRLADLDKDLADLDKED
jgi:hypothetical protein